MILHTDALLLKLQFLTLAGIVVTQPLGWAPVSSILFSLTFVWTACFWLVMAKKRLRGVNVLGLLLMLLSLACVLANAMLTGTALSFGYFKKVFIFCTTLLFFGAMEGYRPEKRTVDFLLRLNTLLALFLGVMYLWQGEAMRWMNGRVTQYLTFRFTNPNLTAAFLAAACILETVGLFSARRGSRWGHGALAVLMACFAAGTRCRNIQWLLLVFFLVALTAALFPRPRKLGPGMAVLIGTGPLVFAQAYRMLVHSPWVRRLFSFWTGDGKPLDSRMVIWNRAAEAFAASPLVGAYSQISGGMGWSQMHNSHLDVLASYGGPACVLFCMFLVQLLRSPEAQGRTAFLCRAGFACLLLSGVGEAMLFSGGMGIYLFAGALRMLANYHWEAEV